MNDKRLGRQTVALAHPPSVLSFSNIGGKFEGQGPLADFFDEISNDSFFGEKTWEKAESAMQKTVLQRALEKAELTPEDLDYILAGDLLNQCIGSSFGLRDFFQRDGVDMGPQFQDCGLLLYDRKHQDMHAGASGCGCSASVLNGYLLRKMREGKWKTILFAPTGALLSPTSSGQGESIPSICHAVRLSAVRE